MTQRGNNYGGNLLPMKALPLFAVPVKIVIKPSQLVILCHDSDCTKIVRFPQKVTIFFSLKRVYEIKANPPFCHAKRKNCDFHHLSIFVSV